MDFDSEVLRFAAQSNERIEQMFNDYFDELAAIGIKTPKDSGVFSFEKDVPPQYREKVDQLTKSFQERLYKEIHAGVDVAYGISLAKHTALLNALFPEGLNVHQPRRKDAREAFIRQRTKPSGRLSLSDRVWNYANQGKAEVEAAMSLAIEDGVVQGKTAAELGRSLRKYLNDPDRMYRRYHTTITLEDGSKKDIVTWRKRVIGPDGKVHFVECEIDKPGQGVYISARANAERCSRSEINGAYRYADYERWNDEEFVIGIKISLSNNHTILEEKKVGKKHVKTPVPFHDICDDLQGNYPKTFKWAGWHPQCRCHATAITASKEDRKQWLAEGCPPGFFDKKYITDAPPQMVKWLNENMDKVQRAKSLPYWIQDNLKMRPSAKGEENVFQMFGVGMKKPAALLMPKNKLTPLEIAAQRHAKRTTEDIRNIQTRWNKRKNDRTKEELRSLLASVEKNDFTKQIKHDIGQLYVDKRTGLYHAGKVEDIKRRLNIAKAATERHKTRDAAAIQEAWTNSRKKSIAQIAKERHDARTPEYIAKVQRTWNQRRLEREKFFSRYVRIENGKIKDKIADLMNELFKRETEIKPLNEELFNKTRALFRNAEAATQRHKTRNAKAILDAWNARKASNTNGMTDKLGGVIDDIQHKRYNFLRPTKEKIEYREVASHSEALREEDIIYRLGGRDRTAGSCSSMAFAFCGQIGGYDVLDYRDGVSRNFFCMRTNIKKIADSVNGGAESYRHLLSKKSVLVNLEEGKYYYYATGRHAAVVRSFGGELQYLELQGSRSMNGWHTLNKESVKSRFNVRRLEELEEGGTIIIPFDNLLNDKRFKELLGYINTDPSKQMKGTGGGLR